MRLTIGGLALALSAAFGFTGLSGCASGDKDAAAEEAISGEDGGNGAEGEDGKSKKGKKGKKGGKKDGAGKKKKKSK